MRRVYQFRQRGRKMLAYSTGHIMSTDWRRHGSISLLLAAGLLTAALYLNHRAVSYQEEAQALDWERIDEAEKAFCQREGLTAGFCERHTVAR